MAESQFLPIKSWTNGRNPMFCLGCDVGGSGLRIRLSNYFNASEYIDVKHIKAQNTADALKSLNKLSGDIKKVASNAQCRGAAIAVAGPIKDNTVVFTNWPGKIENRTVSLSQLPRSLFPAGHSLFLNDLEAGAYGVIAAEEQGILSPLFEQMWPEIAPRGKLISDTRTAVLAMGSGLGVALIVKTPIVPQPLVVPSELGHLQIPTVCFRHKEYLNEQQLIQFVSDHHYNGRQAPEFEDIASGRGLCLAYQFEYDRINQVKIPLDQIDAGEIAQLAQKGDKVARKALLYHYLYFMRAAKAVATTLSCDSVLMALDNQVKNDWFVRSAFDELREEFYHFIRPDWMKSIRVYTQTKTLNFNILGTDYMAHKIADKQ